MKRQCSTDGCDKPSLSRGLCSRHYYQAKNARVLDQVAPNPAGPCAHCGGDTSGRRWGAKFCSADCKQAFYDAEARDETHQRHMRRVKGCAWCREPLPVSKRDNAQTCSRECGIAWQNHQKALTLKRATEAARKPCPVCGGRIPSTRARSAVYCSKACKDSSDASLSPKARRNRAGENLRYLYGLTVEQYEDRLAAQGDRCLICGVDRASGRGRFHVDHCHATGRIRGVLCHHCNLGLGHFKDDPARLRAAAAYLERDVT